MVGQNFERFRLVSHVLRFLSDNLYLVNDLLTLRDSLSYFCLLYTSDAADERSSVDLGGRRIIKKKKSDKLITLILIDMTYRNTHQAKVIQA